MVKLLGLIILMLASGYAGWSVCRYFCVTSTTITEVCPVDNTPQGTARVSAPGNNSAPVPKDAVALAGILVGQSLESAAPFASYAELCAAAGGGLRGVPACSELGTRPPQ
jgi:hypothetical protein